MSADVARVRNGWRFWLGVALLLPVALVLWLRDAALAALTDHPGGDRTMSDDGRCAICGGPLLACECCTTAPAPDALAAAREQVARWLRCATPSYVRAEIRADRARMEAERLADLDAFEAAARAEGAAEFVDYLKREHQMFLEPMLRHFVARSPSSGTEARP